MCTGLLCFAPAVDLQQHARQASGSAVLLPAQAVCKAAANKMTNSGAVQWAYMLLMERGGRDMKQHNVRSLAVQARLLNNCRQLIC
jgi:hypothetical protein